MLEQRKNKKLSQRRDKIETQKSEFVATGSVRKNNYVPQEILSSWKRSAAAVKPNPISAPIDDYEVSHLWKESPLSIAAKHQKDNMKQLTREGELVVAIADPQGRLLWTYASNHMQRRAEALNFTPGGHWDERSVGTNAVGLSLNIKKAVTVFSAEHYLPVVDDWVCYAAPIIHPQSGECVGVLDMSTTWRRHTPLGQAAVNGIARSIARALPVNLPRAELEIFALGEPYIRLQGRKIKLPLRQIEILCLLALNPEGLSLNHLHAVLYGDASVSTTTLKAEVSHLRNMLGGAIGSRPYRLMMPLWGDFLHIWDVLHQQKSNEAISLYRGSFLPQSNSPELQEWRYCISAVIEQTIESCSDPRMLIKKLRENTSRSGLVRERLTELLTS